jgi:hypothetical protein
MSEVIELTFDHSMVAKKEKTLQRKPKSKKGITTKKRESQRLMTIETKLHLT